jgi:hypothetical protein
MRNILLTKRDKMRLGSPLKNLAALSTSDALGYSESERERFTYWRETQTNPDEIAARNYSGLLQIQKLSFKHQSWNETEPAI